jgi:hypothetical protein
MTQAVFVDASDENGCVSASPFRYAPLLMQDFSCGLELGRAPILSRRIRHQAGLLLFHRHLIVDQAAFFLHLIFSFYRLRK